MKPRALFAVAPLALLLPALPGSPAAGAPAAQEGKPVHQYIGVDKCKLCHIKKTTGAAYMVWRKTKHAEAYKTLASPEAKKAAAEKGIADPQKSEECLRCHVSAAGAKPEAIATTFHVEEGVGCEACHGPGSDYYKEEVHAKSREDGVAAGLLIPDEKTCVRCHNEQSPFYKEFKYEEFLKQIEHPRPDKGK